MKINRIAKKQIEKLLKQFPAVGLVGPRQCGKTTIALTIQKELKKSADYFDLESPADLRKFSDIEFFLNQNENENFIIDEVQRLPELFPVLRSVIDKKRKAGRFLLLGSASPEMVKGASESLAGRIYYIEAHPFNLMELPAKTTTQTKHWFRGGFPDAYSAKNDEAYFLWMDGFARTFVERDLNSLFGTNFSPQVMFRLWRMLAHHHAGIWNANSFAKGLDISQTTTNRYLDHLEGAYMIRKLMPFHINIKKRLVKSPKVYIRDSGLLHYLLDIHQTKALYNHMAVSNSWEGYVIEQIIQLLPRTIQAYYYRTHDGSEVDLVLVKGINPIASIEIKYSTSPTVSKGLTESIKDLNTKYNFIITPSKEDSYFINKQVEVVGLTSFLANKLPNIVK
ncbi:MAG: ATP-binding protein [Bacteroidota bacterium]